MSGHTPGPWLFDGPPDNHIVWSTPDERVCFMAHSNGVDLERDTANARLIAAAPELLEALEEIAHLRPGGDVATCVAPRKLIERIEKIALAAIAKATTS